MVAFDVAVLQLPALSPPSFDRWDATCEANALRVACALDSLMSGPALGPRVVALGAQPFTGGSATARAGWDTPPPVAAVAIDLRGSLLDPVIDVCARHGCYVAATVFEAVQELPGRFFHTGFIVGPSGVVLRAPKAQARSAPEVTSLRDMAEQYREVFGLDSICPVVDTPYGKLACAVEKEIYAPEVGRLLAARGAEIVLHPSAAWVTRHPAAGPEVGRSPEREVRRVTAFSNGFFLLSAHESRVWYGSESRWSDAVSTVTGPDGIELATIGPRAEGAAIATVDLDLRRDLAARQGERWTTPAAAITEELGLQESRRA
jgi:predicted amidohydrolase